jgi:crotonobetaine/carnitine-CoA ligase
MTDVLSLPEYLQQGADRWPDEQWCRTPDGSVTRAQVLTNARRAAGALRARGVGPGDHVVLVLPNGIPLLETWFAVVLLGAVSVAVNPRAAHAELAAVCERIDPRLVVATADVPVPAHLARVEPGELVDGRPVEVQAWDPSRPASYIQSSGSTGQPKFVVQTHGMLTMAGEGFPHWLRLGPDDVLMTTLPLSHLNAQAYSTLGSYGSGARLALLPHFSASSFWTRAKEYGATEFNAIGAMLEILLKQEPSPAERDHAVRLCYLGPAPTEERHRQIEERFGLRLVIGYALSESPYGLICSLDEPVAYGSMGRPRQHPRLGRVNEARLVDPTGRDVGPGEVGELLLRNPATTPGYYGDPEQSAQVLRDGWLHTGDLAVVDDAGRYFFHGRLKEVIRHRGENLSPAEVELVLDAHPDVSSSAVVGVPSPLTEEDVKAFVLLEPGRRLDPEALVAWCSERLPSYKRPRYLEVVTEWPLTETQKIAKTRLPRERTDREVDLAAER